MVPPLHRSTISFFGMLSREKYLAVKREKDHFYALDIFNKLKTWNMATGKLISIENAKLYGDQQKYIQYTNFMIFG